MRQSLKARNRKNILIFLLIGIVCIVSIHFWLLLTHDALGSVVGLDTIVKLIKQSGGGKAFLGNRFRGHSIKNKKNIKKSRCNTFLKFS